MLLSFDWVWLGYFRNQRAGITNNLSSANPAHLPKNVWYFLLGTYALEKYQQPRSETTARSRVWQPFWKAATRHSILDFARPVWVPIFSANFVESPPHTHKNTEIRRAFLLCLRTPLFLFIILFISVRLHFVNLSVNCAAITRGLPVPPTFEREEQATLMILLVALRRN